MKLHKNNHSNKVTSVLIERKPIVTLQFARISRLSKPPPFRKIKTASCICTLNKIDYRVNQENGEDLLYFDTKSLRFRCYMYLNTLQFNISFVIFVFFAVFLRIKFSQIRCSDWLSTAGQTVQRLQMIHDK